MKELFVAVLVLALVSLGVYWITSHNRGRAAVPTVSEEEKQRMYTMYHCTEERRPCREVKVNIPIGLMIKNSTTGKHEVWSGDEWIALRDGVWTN